MASANEGFANEAGDDAPLLPSHTHDHRHVSHRSSGSSSSHSSDDDSDNEDCRRRPSQRTRRRLYLSHFLSTWSTRVFEFGAVLYLAALFPGTLLPMSVYALVRGLSAIALAPAVGRYIDTRARLSVVRVSIVFQRLAVALSCVGFYVLSLDLNVGPAWNQVLFALLALLACIEKLCSIMNFVSVEKDWVVVVAGDDHNTLKTMNAQMRRIDLMCKVFGPLFIALLDGFSTRVAILTNLAMNFASVTVEYFSIARVYHDTPSLQVSRDASQQASEPEVQRQGEAQGRFARLWKRLQNWSSTSLKHHIFYFYHPVFLPSISCALLYLTVLSFAGQMTTYLLSTSPASGGFNSTSVGIARTLSVGFEVLATWTAPWLMGRIGPVRAGLWMSLWQVSMLTVGMMLFWSYEGVWTAASAGGLVAGTILSRLGLVGFDLCVQVIVQEEVEPQRRGTFSSVEAAWQNAFEILSFASTTIFHRPSDFRWPTLISLVAVCCASVLYTTYVRAQRGHLLHLEAVRKLCGTKPWRDRAIDNLVSRTNL